MRCSRRGGACSRPSALCSTFSLGSAPSGASWSAAQHHDQSTHAPPLSGCKFGSLHRTDRCGVICLTSLRRARRTLMSGLGQKRTLRDVEVMFALPPRKRTFGSQNSPSEIEEIHDCLAPRHHILIAELDKFANISWLKKQIAGEAPL